MSYTKTNWSTGMVIEADKLNNIENGIKACDDAVITGGTLTLSTENVPTSLTLKRTDGEDITITVTTASTRATKTAKK